MMAELLNLVSVALKRGKKGFSPRRAKTFSLYFVAALTVMALSCSGSFAQQAPASMPKAQQVPLSGRSAGGGGVQAQQSSSGNGGGSSVDTVSATIAVSGAYQGSVPDPNPPQGPLTLNLGEAIQRGLHFNLGSINASASARQLRGARLAALSQMLPDIYATLSETVAKIDLQAQGISAGVFGSIVPPTTVGPFHYYGALANVSENFSMTSLHNLRQARASADAAEMSAEDARELIILAVGGSYLRVLATQANVLSQEAQVKQAEATFNQAEDRHEAGTTPVIDRNRTFVQFHTEQERLTSFRADLVKQTMQLARLIGLPVSQGITLSENLPAQVAAAPPVEESVKVAIQNRSDLKAALLQLKAAEEAHRASRAEYLPSIGVNGDYGVQGINPNKGASVFQASATVTVPIFQSGRVKADVEEADAALSLRQAEYADQQGVVELDVRQAYVDLQVSTEQIAVAAENRRVAAETLTQSVDRFAAGVTDSVEVVQSQETVAAAERDYVSSLFSLNLARLSLARAMGQAEQFIPSMLKGN
jgi:outer membrane protein TolC